MQFFIHVTTTLYYSRCDRLRANNNTIRNLNPRIGAYETGKVEQSAAILTKIFPDFRLQADTKLHLQEKCRRTDSHEVRLDELIDIAVILSHPSLDL